jgi:hypothetical protein
MLISRRVTHRLAATALLGAILFACGERAEKPRPYTCAGKCSPTDPIVVGQPGPPGGTGGTGGGGGGGAPGEDGPVRLVGEVRSLDSLVPFAGTVYRDPVELLVEGEDGDVRGSWTGADTTFSLDGVRRAGVVWARATPLRLDALPTLQPLDTRFSDDLGVVSRPLTVVRTVPIDLAFNVLTLPIERDENLAQVVLVATNDSVPAEGIQVRATGVVVIYAENGGFSDTVTSTDRTGIVLLANVPGSGVTVELSGAVVGRWDVRLLPGGVTVAQVGD